MIFKNKFRRLALAMVVALSGIVANTAQAQEVYGEYKAPPVGTKLVYMRNGEEMATEVTKSDGFDVGFSDGDESYGHIMWIGAGNLVGFTKSDIEQFWPLEVGKSIKFSTLWKYKNHQDRYATVVGLEDVTVPAGTFKAFRVETGSSNKWYQDKWTFWWSPDLGVRIKTEGTVLKGSGDDFRSELVKFN